MSHLRTLALLILLPAGCTPGGSALPDSTPAASPAAAPVDGRRVGTVRVVGSAPVDIRTVLRTDGESVQLVGPLEEELQRLAGAEVAVSGPGDGRQVRVEAYDILSVNGAPVITGTVEAASGEWLRLRTASGEVVYLASPPESFRPGQKVWVQGPRSVIVQSYGTLRP